MYSPDKVPHIVYIIALKVQNNKRLYEANLHLTKRLYEKLPCEFFLLNDTIHNQENHLLMPVMSASVIIND